MSDPVDPAILRRIGDLHAVYRMFDRGGHLLYVGMTGRATNRFSTHSDRSWFPQVEMITLEWHATFAEAKLAEARAIGSEDPRYNIKGTSGRPPRVRGPQAAEPSKVSAADLLNDALMVLDGAPGIHWQTLADQLAERFPERWSAATKESVRGTFLGLGIPSTCTRSRIGGGNKPLAGCRRSHLEEALTAARLNGGDIP